MLFQASASLFFLGNQSLQSQVSEVLTREAFSHFSLHSPKAARQHKRSQRSNSPRWPLTSVSTMFGWLFTFKHKVNTKDSFNVEMDCCWRQRTSLELLECLHCFFFYIFHPFKCCLWDFYIDVPHLKTILSRFFSGQADLLSFRSRQHRTQVGECRPTLWMSDLLQSCTTLVWYYYILLKFVRNKDGTVTGMYLFIARQYMQNNPF